MRAYPDLERNPASPGVGKKGAVAIPGMWWDGKDGTSHLDGGCSLWASSSLGGKSLFLSVLGPSNICVLEGCTSSRCFGQKFNHFKIISLLGV